MATQEVISTVGAVGKIGASIHRKWPWLIPTIIAFWLFWESEAIRNVCGIVLMCQIFGLKQKTIEDTASQLIDEIDKINLDEDEDNPVKKKK